MSVYVYNMDPQLNFVEVNISFTQRDGCSFDTHVRTM